MTTTTPADSALRAAAVAGGGGSGGRRTEPPAEGPRQATPNGARNVRPPTQARRSPDLNSPLKRASFELQCLSQPLFDWSDVKRAFAGLVTASAVVGLALTSAPIAAAQPPAGSVIDPIIVPRPFDIPIWQLPLLPYPFAWEFHMPPPPAAGPNPRPGDTCSSSRVGEISPNKLRCTFMGTPNPARWVEFVPSAINPDGTVKPGAAG